MPAAHKIEVVVYAKPDCTCVESALATLRKFGVEPRVASVDDCPCVPETMQGASPLVAIDGRVRFAGEVDATLLRRLLDRSVEE